MREPCSYCDGKPRGDIPGPAPVVGPCLECDETGYDPCEWCYERTCEDEECGAEARKQQAEEDKADHMRDVARDDRATEGGEL